MQQVEEDFLTLKFARIGLLPALKKFIFDAYSGETQEDFEKRIDIASAIAKKNCAPIIDDIELKKEIAYHLKNSAKIIGMHHECYPQTLRQIPSAPVALSVKGQVNTLRRLVASVAGTREPDGIDFGIIREIVYWINKSGFVVASGLAVGTDSIAHLESMEEGTIGIVGCGISYNYPRENEFFVEKIIEKGGCIVSEYAYKEPPRASNFIQRDRLIAGISTSVFIMRARAFRCGTMATARFAKSFGRKVYTVDFQHDCAGNKYLLNNSMAEKITDFEQVRAGLVMDLFNFRQQYGEDEDEIYTPQSQLFDTKICTTNIAKEIKKWLNNSNYYKITEKNFLKIYELCKNDIQASDVDVRRGILDAMIAS